MFSKDTFSPFSLSWKSLLSTGGVKFKSLALSSQKDHFRFDKNLAVGAGCGK